MRGPTVDPIGTVRFGSLEGAGGEFSDFFKLR